MVVIKSARGETLAPAKVQTTANPLITPHSFRDINFDKAADLMREGIRTNNTGILVEAREVFQLIAETDYAAAIPDTITAKERERSLTTAARSQVLARSNIAKCTDLINGNLLIGIFASFCAGGGNPKIAFQTLRIEPARQPQLTEAAGPVIDAFKNFSEVAHPDDDAILQRYGINTDLTYEGRTIAEWVRTLTESQDTLAADATTMQSPSTRVFLARQQQEDGSINNGRRPEEVQANTVVEGPIANPCNDLITYMAEERRRGGQSVAQSKIILPLPNLVSSLGLSLDSSSLITFLAQNGVINPDELGVAVRIAKDPNLIEPARRLDDDTSELGTVLSGPLEGEFYTNGPSRNLIDFISASFNFEEIRSQKHVLSQTFDTWFTNQMKRVREDSIPLVTGVGKFNGVQGRQSPKEDSPEKSRALVKWLIEFACNQRNINIHEGKLLEQMIDFPDVFNEQFKKIPGKDKPRLALRLELILNRLSRYLIPAERVRRHIEAFNRGISASAVSALPPVVTSNELRNIALWLVLDPKELQSYIRELQLYLHRNGVRLEFKQQEEAKAKGENQGDKKEVHIEGTEGTGKVNATQADPPVTTPPPFSVSFSVDGKPLTLTKDVLLATGGDFDKLFPDITSVPARRELVEALVVVDSLPPTLVDPFGKLISTAGIFLDRTTPPVPTPKPKPVDVTPPAPEQQHPVSISCKLINDLAKALKINMDQGLPDSNTIMVAYGKLDRSLRFELAQSFEQLFAGKFDVLVTYPRKIEPVEKVTVTKDEYDKLLASLRELK